MKIFYPSFFFILSLSIFGCKSDSVQEAPKKAKHIFAKYYVRYLQTEKELKAEVSFKEGDTLTHARSIVLTDVSFEGEQMEVQSLGGNYGVRYSFRKRGPYSRQYKFQYNSKDLGQLSHTLGIDPITDFLIKEGTINKKSGTTLIWKGDPLTENQEMILLFTDEKRKAFPVQIKGPSERAELFLPAEKISNLSIGKGKLMLIKKQLEQADENNFTKISEVEFYSNNIDIEVVE